MKFRVNVKWKEILIFTFLVLAITGHGDKLQDFIKWFNYG